MSVKKVSGILTTQLYTRVNREKQREILSTVHPRNSIELAPNP